MVSLDIIKKRNFTSISPQYMLFLHDKDKCKRCEIYDYYKQIVHSEGCANNPIFMFIGEAGGAEEAHLSRPFIGKSGQLLREELRRHKNVFSKRNTIITNIMSCRPLNNLFPPRESMYKYYYNNREDGKFIETKDIASVCFKIWLLREISILNPRVIITLGSIALYYICGLRGISKYRGKWVFSNIIKKNVFPTFHPSFVLRSKNSGNNRIVEMFKSDIDSVANTWVDNVV